MKFKSGDSLIELARPFAHCLEPNAKGLFCDFCINQNSKLLKCSSCKSMFYCGPKCQREDWLVHKIECKCFASASKQCSIDNSIVRLYFRILILVGVNKEKETIDEAGIKSFDSLVDHYQEITQDMNRMSIFLNCIETLKSIIGSCFFSKFSSKELISYFGKMIINSFSISNFDLSKSIGSAIYLSAASLNHSCVPNCVIIYNGARMIVKAIEDLKEDQEPLVSYIDEMMPLKSRQEYLLKHYYFCCKCSKCSSPQKQNMDQNQLDLWTEEAEKLLEKFKKAKENRLVKEDIEVLLKKALELKIDTLDDQEPSWVNFVKLSEQLMTLFVDQGNDLGAATVAIENLLNSYEKYYPKKHPAIGFLLLKIAKLLINLENFPKAISYFQKAELILKIAYQNTSQSEIFFSLDELRRQINKFI